MNCTDDGINELIPDFLAGELSAEEDEAVQQHLDQCQFCKEFADYIGSFEGSLRHLAAREGELHPDIEALVDFGRSPDLLAEQAQESISTHLSVCRACQSVVDSVKAVQAQAGLGETVILSSLMPDETGPLDYRLAADGTDEFTPTVMCLATFYSESPEVVLRVIMDTGRDQAYLEVMASDPQDLAFAIIRCPELDREYVTDSVGRAEIDLTEVTDVSSLSWHVQAAQAAFQLNLLECDPDKVEYADTMVLETDRGDTIEVSFVGKAVGKTISIKVLQLDGRADYERLRVALVHEHGSCLGMTEPGQTIQLGPVDCDSDIKIHLY
jgi:hypothetical protein